jgi:iron complex outermembrane recepter protein
MKMIAQGSARFLVTTMLAGFAGIAIAPPVQAQTKAKVTIADVDAIIITARKREESLQDVPISVTALSADDLREANAFGLEDVAQSTPGLTFQEAAGVSSPTIRGLSQTDLAAFVNNVGVFVDGVFLNSRSSLEFANLDLQRVEVLKGPQSALYGRDTFAGAINYVTRAPELGKFSGYLQGDVGTDERWGIKGSLNMPLGDHVAVRLFGGRSHFDGTIKSLLGGKNLGGYDKRQTLGASVLLQPIEGMRLKFFFVRNEVREDQPPLRIIPFTANNAGSQYTVPVAGVPKTYFSLLSGKIPTYTDVNIDPRGFGNDGYLNLGYVNVEYDLPIGTFAANYSYSKSQYKTQYANSDDAGAASRPIFPGSAYSSFFFTNLSGDAAQQDSVEIKLSSRKESNIFWMVGASFYDTSTGSITSSTASLVADPSKLEVITNVRRRVRSQAYAAYSAVTVPVTESLNIGGEIRYTDEKQNLTGANEILFIPNFPTTRTNLDSKFSYWTGRVSADYKITDAMMVYAYAARGLKTGGVNQVAATSPFLRFSPETNWTYELGLKSSLLGGRAILNMAAYYIDWQKVQVRAPATLTTADIVINGSGASSKGFEIDTSFNVFDNFTLRAAASYTDPKFGTGFIDGSLNAACALPAPAAPRVVVSACSTDVSGKQLPRTSKFQFFGSATYEIPSLFGDFGGYVRADFSHRDSQTSTSLNLDSTGAIDLANARIGIKNGSFDIAVWVDNAFDKQYNARVLSLSAVGPPVAGLRLTNVYPGNGRTFGATAAFKF